MKRSTFSIVLYLCLVFVSGILVGAFGTGLYDHGKPVRPSPEEMRRRYTEDLRKSLSLNSDQMGKLKVILERTGSRYHDLREKYKPEVKAIQQEQVDSIRAILSDTQKAAYEKFREEKEKRAVPPPGRPPRPGC